MRCHSPYYWKLLEPPGTYRTLGFSWMCPAPQYLKCMAALVCRSPPLSYILFPCSGLCWHALPFPTTGNYWNHLELLGFSWMCPAPQYLKCMAALVCRSAPLSYILFPCSGLCWHALPFPTTGNYWNHLELLGFSWMCPIPST